MLRNVIVAGLLVTCAGCLDTDVPSTSMVQSGRRGKIRAVPLKSTLPEQRAVEIAKAAIVEREHWAKNGFPDGATVRASGDRAGWTVSVFPPIDTPGDWNHLMLYIDNEGMVQLYTESW